MSNRRLPGRAKGERWTVAVFAGSFAVLVVAWLVGFVLRASIWTEPIEVVKWSGMFRVFGQYDDGRLLRSSIKTVDTVNAVLALAAATLGYLGCLWALRKGFARAWPVALGACVVASAVVLPVTPLNSPDAVHLSADVRTLWLYGRYPAWVDNAPAKVDDPVAAQVETYKNAPSGYGPVAYAIGGAPVAFVGDGLRANVFGQKVVAAVFLVLTALGAGMLARKLDFNAPLTAAAVGLNPMMLYQFPADGHNDSIMVAFGVFSMLLAVERPLRSRLGAVGLGAASVLSKYMLILISPVVLAAWLPRLRVPIAAVVLVGGTAIAVLIGMGPRIGLGTLGPATGLTMNTPWYLIVQGGNLDGEAERWLVATSYVLMSVIGAGIVLKHPLDSKRDLVGAVGLMLALLMFICTPTLRHWYQFWYFPFALLAGRRWLIGASLTFSVGGLLTVVALNWDAVIRSEMGIPNPVNQSIVFVWVATVAVGLLVWFVDREKAKTAMRPTGAPRGMGRSRARARARA